ncbi:cysteine desulfurase family protein [Thermostichus vulcanus]|uniref:cysteine desulfurase n=1 Tax=Thermostichus vulcanus str. 'Rupite' TaxID=2813851 RepID=A0ABT0CA82_THEVL|nr:cysteine desulfurase family protein [Thermostichus vulcanus]MCJ2542683.1 cysteine desulfurase [Thermostichus vulcanus str. 'Rupite']
MLPLDPALYFDHSATTPPRPEVIEAMQQAMQDSWGNPSSLHAWGERAAMAMERARQQVADLLHCEPESLLFTSGGTESNNLALFGVAQAYSTPQHLIISSVEHSSVENAARQLQSQGWQVTRLPVNRFGQVDPEQLKGALQPNTALVSILHGQNEVGSLQPIAELGHICRQAGVLFHTDAVQTVGRIRLDLAQLPIDMLSLSGHKLYGPQGVGALYLRPGVELRPLLRGGGQERRLRSGTQGIPGIVGLGVAAALAAEELEAETERLRRLQRQLDRALQRIPGLTLTGPPDLQQRLPHHLSYCTDWIPGNMLVTAMSRQGIGISAGSACSSGQLIPSRILLAMGYSEAEALGSIRLSLGKATTAAAVEHVACCLQGHFLSNPGSGSLVELGTQPLLVGSYRATRRAEHERASGPEA